MIQLQQLNKWGSQMLCLQLASSFFMQIKKYKGVGQVLRHRLVGDCRTCSQLVILNRYKTSQIDKNRTGKAEPLLDYSNTFHSKSKFREKMKGEQSWN